MVQSRLFRAAMFAAVASAGLVAGGLTQANAAPPALANQSFNLDHAASRNGLGTLDYTTDPGCGAGGLECVATATLNSLTGASAVSVDIGSAAAGGGDENYAQLYYYVQYNGSSPVVIHMSDSLTPAAPARTLRLYFGFGVAQLDPNGFPPLSSGILGYGVGPIGDDGSIIGGAIESLTDCASGSGYGRLQRMPDRRGELHERRAPDEPQRRDAVRDMVSRRHLGAGPAGRRHGLRVSRSDIHCCDRLLRIQRRRISRHSRVFDLGDGPSRLRRTGDRGALEVAPLFGKGFGLHS